MFARRFLLCLAFVSAAISAHAQLQVSLHIPRHLYMVYEPVIATVSVTNRSGRDVMLDEIDGQKWFSFQIFTGEDRLVPPRDLNYEIAPLMIPSGETVKRSVNLVSLYPITDFGLYRIKASIYFPDLHRYFSSSPMGIEISEGKLLWQQTIGVPGEQDAYRIYSLLSFRQPKDNVLYVRVEDKDGSAIYATFPLGPLIAGNEPQIQLDEKNQLHVLQLVGPKTFTYSRIGPNGEWLGQVTYAELKSRPVLKRLASGKVDVIGGAIDAPAAQAANGPPSPKLSDRPAGMPAQ